MRCGRVCLGSGLRCALQLLAGLFGCVFVCVRAPLVARQSWLGRAVWVFVLWLGFRLRPATPGWGVGVCVCVCVRAQLVPRHSWLGCAVWVCVLGLGFVLCPATPGWGVRCGCVCLGSGLCCAPPLLAGVLGCVCVCLRAPLVPRNSLLACAMGMCVLRLWYGLPQATPGWGVAVFVCLCAPSSCTQPLLAGVCGVGIFAWAPVWAAPRHSWLGRWGVSVFVCALRLYPATVGRGLRPRCVCWGSGFSCAPLLLARVFGCVCVCVHAPLVPRHSCLPCAVWVGVLGLESRLRPATPGGAAGPCVCLCAPSSCTPPLLKKVPTRTGPRCAPSACNPCRFAPDQRLHCSKSKVANPKI